MYNYPEQAAMATLGGNAKELIAVANPTLRENITRKINWHKDEIARLEQVAASMPEQLLDMNLRDLREAMSF